VLGETDQLNRKVFALTVRADTLEAMLKVQKVRKENDLPPCGK
jgi:hypothetical protein